MGSWRGTLATILEVFLTTCLQAVVGAYETLQGRSPAARALVQSGLARFRAVLAVVVVVFGPNLLVWVYFEVPRPGWLLLIGGIFLVVAIPAAAVEVLDVMRSIARAALGGD